MEHRVQRGLEGEKMGEVCSWFLKVDDDGSANAEPGIRFACKWGWDWGLAGFGANKRLQQGIMQRRAVGYKGISQFCVAWSFFVLFAMQPGGRKELVPC